MHFAIIQALNQCFYGARLIAGRFKPAVDFKFFFHLNFSIVKPLFLWKRKPVMKGKFPPNQPILFGEEDFWRDYLILYY